MMANLVEIVIKATDQASTVINNIGSGLGKYTDKINGAARALTGLDASSLATGYGVTKLVDIYKKAIDSTMAYAKEIRDLSRDIGGTPEDISKLIQAADDAQVSFETLKMSMIMANKQGIDVTIEGMSNLAEQYLAIQDPLERTKFLTDTFGRAGEKMGAFMEMGAAGIEAAGIEAEKYGRILDESAIKQTEAFRIAQDNLDDSLSKMKDTMALEVIPSLATLLNTVTPVITAYNSLKGAVNGLDPALKGIVTTFYAFLDPIKMILGPLYALIDAFKNLISLSNQLGNTSTNIPSFSYGNNPPVIPLGGVTSSTKGTTVPTTSKPSASAYNAPAGSTIYTHRASGGSVYAGNAYWVGEQGPEPFIPKTDGTIVSNKNAMGGMNDSQYKALLQAVTPNYDMMANAFKNALSQVMR